MRRKIKIGCLSLFLLVCCTSVQAEANLFEILQKIADIYGINKDSLDQLKNLDKNTLKELEALTGKHQFGQIGYRDFQSWGSNYQSWDNALTGYKTGQGSVGSYQDKFNKQFPIKPNYKNLDAYSMQKEFDTLQAQTALASRAASQEVFDRIQKQINYQKTLQQKIDETHDMKSAVDLQNRLLFENNMIALDTLRLMAMNAQQQSIELQANANAVTLNKAFVSGVVD